MIPSFVKKIFLFPILIFVLLVLSSLIEPMKTETDVPRNSMNCPNSPTFNQTLWDNQTENQHTIYSTGCYGLHWDVIAFIGGLTALAIFGWFTK